MTTIALVTLCAAFLAVITVLVLVLRSEVRAGRTMRSVAQAAGEQQLAAERNQIEAETQRDVAINAAAQAQAALAKALEQLAATQIQRNVAVAKLAERLRTDIVGMSDTDAIAVINAELGL